MRPGKIRSLFPIIVCALCGLLGMGVSTVLGLRAKPRPSHQFAQAEADNHPAQSESHSAPNEKTQSGDPLASIDSLVALGDYRKAYRDWNRAKELDWLPDEPAVRIREAIILEGLSRFNEAKSVYEKLVPALPWSGRLGSVRCEIGLNHLRAAERELNALDESAGSVSTLDAEFRAEIRYLRAYIRLRQRTPDPVDRLAPRWHDPMPSRLPGDHILRLALKEGSRKPAKPGMLAWLVSWHHPPEEDEVEDENENKTKGPSDMSSLLRDALHSQPEHPWAPRMRLEWARCETDSDPWRAAVIFEDLLQHTELPPDVAVAARAELAWAQIRRGDKGEARDNLLQVIDSRPDGPLAPWAWFQIARIHTDFAEFDAAIRAYRLCLSWASGVIRLAAGLGLAAVYLYEDEPYLARKALESVKSNGLRTGPFWTEGAFLDALARFRIGGGMKGRTRSIRDELIVALAQFPAGPVSGPIAQLLQCQTRRELGLTPLSPTDLDRAAGQARGRLSAELTWEFVLSSLHQGDEPTARRHLENLLVTDHREVGAKAHLLLARLELQAGRPKACLQLCLQIPSALPAQRDERLLLMGEAYSRLGDPKRAAECFAGRDPIAMASSSRRE
jgi:tetratricopeptide (TPR) repeat protein